MKDPAFLFYYQDFLVGTDEMTNEEVGAYIRCLCHQAHKGHISEKHMKNICNSSEVHNTIKSKFISENNDGLFINSRLKLEIEKRQKYTESRSNNRKGKTKDSKYISITYEKHMENENENENENEDVIKEENTCFSFNEFWNLYDKKEDRKKCEDKYKKLTESERMKIKSSLPLYLVTIKEKQYQKNPQTYLNGKCWNDEKYQPKEETKPLVAEKMYNYMIWDHHSRTNRTEAQYLKDCEENKGGIKLM
jgi:hypothetical protein